MDPKLEEMIRAAFIAGVMWDRQPSGAKEHFGRPVTTLEAAQLYAQKIRREAEVK